MAVSAKRVRELSLSLENASSYPHFDRVAFRTPRRIFCTLGPDGRDVNFAFSLEQQREFCELAPHAISPVPGGWGRMGYTRCDLAQIDLATFKRALAAAHARANAPLPKRNPLRKKAPSQARLKR